MRLGNIHVQTPLVLSGSDSLVNKSAQYAGQTRCVSALIFIPFQSCDGQLRLAPTSLLLGRGRAGPGPPLRLGGRHGQGGQSLLRQVSQLLLFLFILFTT